jgi:hypothetical protein
MGLIEWIVVMVSAVVVLALLGWMWFGRKRPDRASAGAEGVSAPRRTNDYPSTIVDRPADAGAEDQDVGVGDARPGAPGPPA